MKNKDRKKNIASMVKIRFQDCDPFNHLNNSKYIDYFLNAREDQVLHHYGINVFDLSKNHGKSWVVASNQIGYFVPATTMETVCITSKVVVATKKTLLVEMQMWDEQQQQLKALLWVKFVYFDVFKNTIALHSDELMQLFYEVLVQVPETTFEERSRFLHAKP